MNKKKVNIRKGDMVKIISGKYKGQNGLIKNIIHNKELVTIENINIKTKHVKPQRTEDKGYIDKLEGPIHYSKIKIIGKDN
uniref:Large ribosomal subunit protein uL24c n=1 Tax=Digenea simplex TaxID=945030 RepID=A0A1Z1MV14_DIGSM|nr:ribosomal protein L24 [Digenea simplex]ARW69585.1 ribosomal protein L24 [Digenea simplex]